MWADTFLTAIAVSKALVVGSSAAWVEHTRVSNPSVVSVETFGRAFMGSVNFDRVVADGLAAGIGIGIGRVSTQNPAGADTSVTATLIPVYANCYFTRDSAAIFATGGAG